MKDEATIPSPDALMDRQAILQAQLAELRQRHQALNAEIDALGDASIAAAAFEVRRLKKQKLALKDHIIRLQDQLLPDIIA